MEIKVRPLPQKSREFSASTVAFISCIIELRVKLEGFSKWVNLKPEKIASEENLI